MRLNYWVDYLIVLLTTVNSLFKNKILIVQISLFIVIFLLLLKFLIHKILTFCTYLFYDPHISQSSGLFCDAINIAFNSSGLSGVSSTFFSLETVNCVAFTALFVLK